MTLLYALIAITLLALLFGGILGFAAIRFKVEGDPLVDELEAMLPQTQCGQCGYPGCRPYAEAIANGDAINKCPPGGEATMLRLADHMGVEPQPVDAEETSTEPMVAFIREDDCIGCTKCIQACPVDAIIGANRAMHTIIADECTGCEKCVAPCPTDCIDMISIKKQPHQWQWQFEQISVKTID